MTDFSFELLKADIKIADLDRQIKQFDAFLDLQGVVKHPVEVEDTSKEDVADLISHFSNFCQTSAEYAMKNGLPF